MSKKMVKKKVSVRRHKDKIVADHMESEEFLNQDSRPDFEGFAARLQRVSDAQRKRPSKKKAAKKKTATKKATKRK
jgi:hypothetical protein